MRPHGGRCHRRATPAAIILKGTLALAGLAFATGAHAECSRATLQGLTDTYVAAQEAGDPAMVPLADGAYYGENDKAVDAASGILAEALPVDFTRSFHDTAQCATFTELTAATNPHPYVIHTRMEVNEAGEVARLESVVTDADDWVFGASEHLTHTRAENWGEIPAERRDRREVIQAAADAYLDNWGDPDLPVPHGTPCTRLEGRIYTDSKDPGGQTCTMGAFPQPIETGNRRYVIDETVGAVSIFHNFSWIDAGLPAGHPGTPASQTFRVENGMNRYIHEVTACGIGATSMARSVRGPRIEGETVRFKKACPPGRTWRVAEGTSEREKTSLARGCRLPRPQGAKALHEPGTRSSTGPNGPPR